MAKYGSRNRKKDKVQAEVEQEASVEDEKKESPVDDADEKTADTKTEAAAAEVETAPQADAESQVELEGSEKDEAAAEEAPATAPDEPEDADASSAADIELARDADEDLEDEEDYESEDSLTFSNGVIEKIVAIAMRDVPGVIGMKGGWINRVQETFGVNDKRKGVVVEVTPDSAVKVNISVLIEYGSYAPQVFEDVKKTVVKQVTGMTGLRVAGVNLRIEDVLTPEEYEAGRRAESGEAQQGAASANEESGNATADVPVADAPTADTAPEGAASVVSDTVAETEE